VPTTSTKRHSQEQTKQTKTRKVHAEKKAADESQNSGRPQIKEKNVRVRTQRHSSKGETKVGNGATTWKEHWCAEGPTTGGKRVPFRGLRRMLRHKFAADPRRQRVADLGWHAHQKRCM